MTIGASIGGDLGFGLPAGNIKCEPFRRLRAGPRTTWTATSCRPTSSTAPACACASANGGAPVRWVQNTNAPVEADNNVYEVALEMNIPLLTDMPVIQELSVNLAGRYTKYSSFDAVWTWKAGAPLAGQRLDRLPRHHFARHPGAEPQRPVPAGRRLFDGLQGPADRRQQQPAADYARQSGPDRRRRPARSRSGWCSRPTSIPGLSDLARLLQHQDEGRDHLHQLSERRDPESLPVQRAYLRFARSARWRSVRSPIRPIRVTRIPNFNFPTEVLNSPLNTAKQKTEGYELQVDYGSRTMVEAGHFSFCVTC